MKHSYPVIHSLDGVRAGFVLGEHGQRGGFISANGDVPPQDVRIGYRYLGESWTVLPFFETSAVEVGFAPLPAGRYGRALSPTTDRWMAQAMVFSLAVARAPDRNCAGTPGPCPALFGLLDYDNAHMDEPVELLFAVGKPGAPWQPCEARPGGGPGWQSAGRFGIATSGDLLSGGALCSVERWTWAGAAGFRFQLGAGARAVVPVVLGFAGSQAVVGSPMPDMATVLDRALRKWGDAVAAAKALDQQWRACGGSPEAQFTEARAQWEVEWSTLR